jgi:crotonobetainyl-CoA:carnitine CoA-transferase CaiB-like acyl-CoA transferase
MGSHPKVARSRPARRQYIQDQTKAATMKTITKDQFVSLLNDAGITDAQKHKLHSAFEARHPRAHEAFLQWLGLPADAIQGIREKARKPNG